MSNVDFLILAAIPPTIFLYTLIGRIICKIVGCDDGDRDERAMIACWPLFLAVFITIVVPIESAKKLSNISFRKSKLPKAKIHDYY